MGGALRASCRGSCIAASEAAVPFGGGVKAGASIGETDELGLRALDKRLHMRDFHATILNLLGLDQNRLWFLHNGRNEKLTDFGGNVIQEMLA